MRDQWYDSVWCNGHDFGSGIPESPNLLHDSAVYEHAWHDFEEAARSDRPFNITVLTLDAHGPIGLYSSDEPAYPLQPPFPKNLYDAMYASDCALGKFIRRIKAHKKYRDTCIVITNDHLAHKNTCVTKLLETNPKRRLVFIIHNSVEKNCDSEKEGRTFDIGPTILDALGVKHDYVFPLGESLYRKTGTARLNTTEDQEYALAMYTMMKSQFSVTFPDDISLSRQPYAMLNLGHGKWPLFANEVCDIPRGNDAWLLPVNGTYVGGSLIYCKNADALRTCMKSHEMFVFISANSPKLQTTLNRKIPGKFVLGVGVHGRNLIRSGDDFAGLAFSRETILRETGLH